MALQIVGVDSAKLCPRGKGISGEHAALFLLCLLRCITGSTPDPARARLSRHPVVTTQSVLA